jgi:hypothetical protein
VWVLKLVRKLETDPNEVRRLQEIRTASLSGGLATISRHLAPGTPVQLRLHVGMRHMLATAMMRDYRAQDMAFEIVDMNLEEAQQIPPAISRTLPPTTKCLRRGRM